MTAIRGPVPDEVCRLAERRAQARAGRDFSAADALREEIVTHGWTVRDVPDGFALDPLPAFDVLPGVEHLPDRSTAPNSRRCSVALLVEGWPDDVRSCLDAWLRWAPADVVLLAVDLGDVDGAGRVLHEVAGGAPGRVEAWHVAHPSGWAAARTALLRADTAAVHVWAEISTLPTGDALTPLLDAFTDPAVAAAGWRGVDASEDWTSFADAVPGSAAPTDVDALLGYLLAARRSVALAAGGPDPAARYYRNADMEFSFALREAGRPRGCERLVVVGDLPVEQGRHHGYLDVDPAYRERESRRTYNRFLGRFRGRDDLRARRDAGPSPDRDLAGPPPGPPAS